MGRRPGRALAGARAGGALGQLLTAAVQFDLACDAGPRAYAVRRRVPPVNRRHVHRLPAALQQAHDEWVATRLEVSALEHARRRARALAFILFEQGDDLDHVEHVLIDTGFHPSICRETAQWAYDRHRAALEALGADRGTAA
jgi:hypothetical protein